ncbi:MAG: helix-turn-helix domain-containing protein [Ruminococcaceae bacterium]|nr:helix-turn-helix domain-containing protein [Oscillospiraceae bacterium]
MNNKINFCLESEIDDEFSTGLYSGGVSRYMNTHINFEILIVERGEAICYIDGNEYRIFEGEAVFIFPLQLHSFRTVGDSSLRRVTFCENIILTLAIAIKQKKAEDPVFSPKKEFLTYFLSEMNEMFGADEVSFKRIMPLSNKITVKGLLYAIGGSFLSQAKLVPFTNSKNSVIDVVHYISKNYTADITLRDVASSLGYNHQYLSRELNKTLGISFSTILNQYRMNHAYALLNDTNLPINQIAFECGFKSIRNFNHVCTEIFGKSPREIRINSHIG